MQVEALADLGPARRHEVFDRHTGVEAIHHDVSEIVDTVRTEGDVALRRFTEEFDDVTVGNLDITADLERAYDSLDDALLEAIETAAANIRHFHRQQTRTDWYTETAFGEIGRRFRPIERIGAYVPGGTAAYPSSALMTVVPAKVAGVDQVAVATPPGDPIHPATKAALHIAGADEVYQVGGAQAIAALAHGTESIPAVSKIVGPGNPWVTAAKGIVQGTVEIDFLAGPSEILVIADESADPSYVASDLLAQAEHGADSPCIAIVTEPSMGEAIIEALDEQLSHTKREALARAALEQDTSAILIARSMSEAISFAEEYAPEHLSIQTNDPRQVAERIPSAGSVFLGPFTPVAAGDYATGTNHVLPTNGLAKRTGGLSVDDFVRSTTVQQLTEDGLHTLSPTITKLAEAEGLNAHAESVRIRTEASGRQD